MADAARNFWLDAFADTKKRPYEGPAARIGNAELLLCNGPFTRGRLFLLWLLRGQAYNGRQPSDCVVPMQRTVGQAREVANVALTNIPAPRERSVGPSLAQNFVLEFRSTHRRHSIAFLAGSLVSKHIHREST